ncbi:MAG TPA: hypothetical protein PLT74_08165, partial [Kiritimatiellia bacterium]|nr:hypothetical protein [Kiritimatiellia bacterium]HQL50815.1 hypothetical protein [Kiritimatiellia bacterium]
MFQFLERALTLGIVHPADVVELPLQGRETPQMRNAERGPVRFAPLRIQLLTPKVESAVFTPATAARENR